MSSQLAVLSQYPLSAPFTERLCARYRNTPTFLTLSRLRQLGLVEMLSELRSHRGEIVIGLEDPTSVGALPILKFLAATSGARRITVVDHGLAETRVNRSGQVLEAARLLKASVEGRIAMRRASAAAEALLRQDRIAPVRRTGIRHVGYINTNLWFGQKAGGSVGHISGVANGFLEHGYSLDYLSVGGRLLIKPEATVHELAPPSVFGFPYEINLYGFDLSFERQAAGLIDPDRTSFLYQRLSLGNFTGVRLSRSKGLPLVVEYNGSEVWVAKNWGRPLRYAREAAAAEEATLRHAHVVVTISDVLRDELIGRGVEPERIVTYPNCIDPERFDPQLYPAEARAATRRSAGLDEDACVATFVGTFGAWHGAEVFAEAIRRLCEQDAETLEATGLRFLFVGDGLRLPAVRAILDGDACRPYVRYTGLVPQDRAPAYLAASDILVSPHVPNTDGTPFFGSPTKLFEYLAMEKAIVGSDLDQVGQVLRNSIGLTDIAVDPAKAAAEGRLALLLPPGDAPALAKALAALAGTPALRWALGANARKEALARYTWRRHVEVILDRLDALVV